MGAISGELTAIAVTPQNASDIWVGASTGGVWHTTDGGTSWTPMTDGQPTLAVGSIAIDPTNPHTIYVGTGDANRIYGNDYPGLGVLKSSDNGQTWADLDPGDFAGLAIGKIVVDSTNPQVLLLSAGWDGSFLGNPDKSGIWRSTNAGANWTQVLSDPGHVFPDAGTDVVLDPANHSIAFAGLGNLYALNATTASGVYESTDNGQHWTQLTALPTGSDVERVSLGLSADGNHVYAVLTDGDYRDTAFNSPSYGDLLNRAVYVSTDTGTTWTSKVNTDTGYLFWWYASFAQVDPTDTTGNTIYVGSFDVLKSTNGGTTWSDITSNAPEMPRFQHALAFFSGSSSPFYVGNAGGIWSGDSNVAVSNGNPMGAFVNRNGVGPHGLGIAEVGSASIGTAGTQAQLYASSGPWWGVDQYPAGAVSSPAAWNLIAGYSSTSTGALVDYSNNAIVYNESRGNYLEIDESADGATSWTPITFGTLFGALDTANYAPPFIMSPSNSKELFVGTDRIFRFNQGGWAAISPVLDPASPCNTPTDPGCVPISALAVAPGNDSVIYVGDDNGNVYTTTDGGANWGAAAVPCPVCGAWVTSLASRSG